MNKIMKRKIQLNALKNEWLEEVKENKRKYADYPFICNVCGKGFMKKCQLRGHVVYHTDAWQNREIVARKKIWALKNGFLKGEDE